MRVTRLTYVSLKSYGRIILHPNYKKTYLKVINVMFQCQSGVLTAAWLGL